MWPEPLRVIELLQEVVTRWSSTFWMLDRILELREVWYIQLDQNYLQYLTDMIYMQPIRIFLTKYLEETQSFILTQKEMIVLDDIVNLLDIFNTVQSLLSASKQPTLPLVIPAYEYLVHLLKHSRDHGGRRLSHAIDAALSKIDKHLPGFKLNPLYGIATGACAFFTWHFSLTVCQHYTQHSS